MRLSTLLASLTLLAFAAGGCGDDESTPATTDESAAATVTAETATTEATETTATTEKKRKRPSAAGKSTATTESTATVEADTDPPDTSTSSDGEETPATPAPSTRTRAEAVDACLEGVERYKVSAERKEELRDICRAFGSGDQERIREAALKLCEQFIPEGSSNRDAAIEQCKKSAANSKGFAGE